MRGCSAWAVPRPSIALVWCAIVFLAVAGPPAEAATSFPLTVTDALGRRVTLAAPPRRIISVAPSVTEILFALGLDRRIVGVSDADDYPPEAVAGKPRVGGVVLDVERILRLRPDLVLGAAGLQRGQLERLAAMGLPVVAVDARTLPEVYEQIAVIARLTGTSGPAAAVVARLRAREILVREAVAGAPVRRVYVEIWGEPLTTAGGDTFVSDLIARVGGVNVFADVRGWPQVSAEAVIRRDPQVIVVTYPQGLRSVARRRWPVAAVRQARIAAIDASLVSRPGPRLVDGLAALARIVHPERAP